MLQDAKNHSGQGHLHGPVMPAAILPGCKDIHHHVQRQKELSEQEAMPASSGELSRAHTEIPADI